VPPEASVPPSPLPVIGTTKTTLICTVLREHLAPAVLAVMHNDELIASSKVQYREMGLSGPRQDLDLVAMARNVQAMVNNLSIFRKQLDNEASFPTNPKTDDERSLVSVRSQLQEVVADQTRELDTINGVLETILLKKMMHSIPGTPRLFASNRRFFVDVAAAIDEQAVPIEKRELQLDPTLISMSSRCGAAKP
jgi:hypothetical protein